jgi:hypothetical protein
VLGGPGGCGGVEPPGLGTGSVGVGVVGAGAVGAGAVPVVPDRLGCGDATELWPAPQPATAAATATTISPTPVRRIPIDIEVSRIGASAHRRPAAGAPIRANRDLRRR